MPCRRAKTLQILNARPNDPTPTHPPPLNNNVKSAKIIALLEAPRWAPPRPPSPPRQTWPLAWSRHRTGFPFFFLCAHMGVSGRRNCPGALLFSGLVFFLFAGTENLLFRTSLQVVCEGCVGLHGYNFYLGLFVGMVYCMGTFCHTLSGFCASFACAPES